MVYINERGAVTSSRNWWSLSTWTYYLWGFADFMALFFKTLVQPGMNSGSSSNSYYGPSDNRRPPRPPSRRFGGFSSGQCGPGSPPMAGGG